VLERKYKGIDELFQMRGTKFGTQNKMDIAEHRHFHPSLF